VYAGIYITGQSGTSTNATGDVDEVNIHSVDTYSHTMNLSADADITVSVVDNETNESAQSSSLAATVQTGATPALKWHPGWYMQVRSGDRETDQSVRFGQYDQIADNDDIVGVAVMYRWVMIEETLGDYSVGFSAIDAEITKLQSLAEPKRLIIRIKDIANAGRGCPASDHFPSYINSNGWLYDNKEGCRWKFWLEEPMDYYIDMVTALCDRYDNNPHVEAIHLIQETASAFGGDIQPGFTWEAAVANYKRLATAAAASCKQTMIIDMANWMGSQATADDYVGHVLSFPNGASGQPDSCATVPQGSRYSHGDMARFGLRNVVTGQTDSTLPDSRGVKPFIYSLQGSEMGAATPACGADYLPQAVYDWAESNKISHISIHRHVPTATWGATEAPCDEVGLCDWSAWLTFMETNKLTTTACPSGVTQGCNTSN
jgi:hypothetical protein